ncbi:protein adenylyltransferase Fic [Tribolium madens]|uniref:protein adenylyltransferase Fic n=1 Tax=Tribolium madens TaxID=41895 RepID=UPI001CF75399|nr:protein adenylyltransferase Fic [Tribolium madens]
MKIYCNIVIFIISVLVCLLCILISVIQYYYLNYNFYKKQTSYAPIFEDLIATDSNNNFALSYTFNAIEDHSNDNFILSNLNALLESHYTPTTGSSYLDGSRNFNVKSSNSEVLNILQAAIGFQLAGKNHKALKLLEHATAIAPDNPDVLNWYGEFLEQIRHDVVTADELYFKALTHSPTHAAALTNHKRTSPVVDRLDLELFKSIDKKKDYLKKQFDSYNFETLKKQAYYLHIYHTVGIEGNTMTVEQLRTLLETGQVIQGKSIIEHNEVLGLQLALKYVKSLARKEYITVDDILQMHKRVMGHVDPLTSGIFRDTKVFVGRHIPPPSEKVPALMESYVNWLNSDEARNMHPVRYAALAHYKLVDIHPFVDGNGRTSRLIMNLILLRGGYPPIMILKEQRDRYYDALNVANVGDVRPFVRFIAHCTLQILDMYIHGTQMLVLDGDSTEGTPTPFLT